MTYRIPLLASLALSSLLLSGCAAAAGSVGTAPAPPSGTTSGASAPAGAPPSSAVSSTEDSHGGHHGGASG
ncbi:hypothetical protein [Pseudarthrobacter sp. NamB4]|uniref:hypothetical protein n=1 Tax=Pseudarthrobacter sp. NamB4 TaxID=2576837 RepID=UPI001F1107EF|nr:hypothetical protein [Pseudarthrobacter sp. NamB4]